METTGPIMLKLSSDNRYRLNYHIALGTLFDSAYNVK